MAASKATIELAKSYLARIKKELESGDATEHTHRPALKDLMEGLNTEVTATNEPKRVACGAPDYVVKKHDLSVGYIEAKDIGKSLDEAEDSEQLKRYRKSLPNLILTDYLEFRWYVDGEPREKSRLAKFGKGKLILDKEGIEETISILSDFLSHRPASVTSPKELSQRLARLAHIIRDIIVEAFKREEASVDLKELRDAFAQVLIPDINQPEKISEFADMYAQTIVYGLFAARVNHNGPEPFQRLGAAREIPKTNPFLKKLFETITGSELDDEPYVDFVEDLAHLLANTVLEKVLEDFGKRTKQEDPIVHFYETFLEAYDPKMRERRGVYYTPAPVTQYIVKSVDYILQTRFGLGGGLADSSKVEYDREEFFVDEDGKPDRTKLPKVVHETSPKVLVLDPACGTGTFLYAVMDHIRSEFMNRGDAGLWSAYVQDHLLPRFFGFELLMAPYAVAHFKLGMLLAGYDLLNEQQKIWKYDFEGDERLRIYLTNTLKEAPSEWQKLFGAYRILSEEANAASRVKRDLPILVVLGNPPYSGQSANSSWDVVRGKRKLNFIGQLLKDYYYVDGKPLNERQSKWLQDDYVKFIRWGQWRIEQTGTGVLAFITNHGYLDNPTFRGMRQQLMNTFHVIYILDLHGNTKKKERAPDGSADENVFDIQQGVAIGIFIKEPGNTNPVRVFHADLWGARGTEDGEEGKYSWLLNHDAANTEWKELSPQPPFYLFKPIDKDLSSEFYGSWNIKEIFIENNVGFVTARDKFAIDFDYDILKQKIFEFRNLNIPDLKFIDTYKLKNTTSWNLSESRKRLADYENWTRDLQVCLYRPFDLRYIYYSKLLLERPGYQIMRHMLAGDNIGLISARSNKSGEMNHFFVTRLIMETKCGESTTQSYIFPLYLYPSSDEKITHQNNLSDINWLPGKNARMLNLNPDFVTSLESSLGIQFVSDGLGDLVATFGPEDVFHYIYAVFHSPTYRTRYAEFLQSDFPRVPLVSNVQLFRKLCALGKELVALHLLESPQVTKLITRYPVAGDNFVEKGFPKFVAYEEGKPGYVYINKTQYLEGVPKEVYEFHVGGYKVCEKWLKDRIGIQLSYDDLTHYQKVIVALKETIRLMEEIDKTIPEGPIK